MLKSFHIFQVVQANNLKITVSLHSLTPKHFDYGTTYTTKMSLAICGLGLSSALMAQDFSGLHSGNWAGVHSLHINPANVVDNRFLSMSMCLASIPFW